MQSFTHTSCKFIRLLEKISSSKTMLAYLQYDKELFASCLWHTPLTCLSGPDPSPIRHSCDILGLRIHDRIPSQLPHFPNLNTSMLNNGNVFHEGVGIQPRLLLSTCKSLIECIRKGGGRTRSGLQNNKFIIITCSCLMLFLSFEWNELDENCFPLFQ